MAFVLVAGCRDAEPDEALRPLLEDLSDPTRSSAQLADRLVRALDLTSREALSARATAIEAALGRSLEASMVLQPRGLLSGQRVTGVDIVARDADRARLRLTFEPLVSGNSSNPLEIEVIREDGSWKLALKDLATFVAGTPVVAGSTGEAP